MSDNRFDTPESLALWLEGWCDHTDGQRSGPGCCVWRGAAAQVRDLHRHGVDLQDACARYEAALQRREVKS